MITIERVHVHSEAILVFRIEKKITICVRTDRRMGAFKEKVDRNQQGGWGLGYWQKMCRNPLWVAPNSG